MHRSNKVGSNSLIPYPTTSKENNGRARQAPMLLCLSELELVSGYPGDPSIQIMLTLGPKVYFINVTYFTLGYLDPKGHVSVLSLCERSGDMKRSRKD